MRARRSDRVPGLTYFGAFASKGPRPWHQSPRILRPPSPCIRTIPRVTAPSGPFVGVALDLPMDTLFTYRVPDPWRNRVRIGQRVRVPFRKKHLVGLVAEVSDSCK